MSKHVAVGALALALVLPSTAVGGAGDREPHAFLQRHAAFAGADLEDLDGGSVVTKTLDPSDPREVAVLGVARVAVPGAYFLARVRDIARFKRGDAVLQIGKFSAKPRLADLAGLKLEPADLKALEKCEVGDCGMRLSAPQIERLRREVGASRSGAGRRAEAALKRILVDYVNAYLAGGNAALAEYRSGGDAVNLAEETRGLLAASPYLTEYAPEFRAYLEQFPKGRPAGAESFVYWSKESFGLKPVVSITHVVLYPVERAGVSWVLMASKQIYASHYFDASLGVTAFVEGKQDGPGAAGSYLIYLNRSRASQLQGSFSRLRRNIVEEQSVDGMKRYMADTKRRLESEYRKSARRP
jgi:hypothetical protein